MQCGPGRELGGGRGEVKNYDEDLIATPALEELSALPNVRDVCLGFRRIAGKMSQELAVVVYVDRKRPEAELPKGAVVPKFVANLKTDVTEELDASCYSFAVELPEDSMRERPLKSGVSIGISDEHAGTLGFFARRNSDNKPVMVSNYHVLYRGRLLLDIAGEPHEAFQPPIGTDNKIGDVADGNIGGTVDCAMAVLDEEGSSCCCKSPIKHENKTRNTETGGVTDNSLNLVGIRRAQVGDIVHKTGRRTDRTMGKIISVNKAIPDPVDASDRELPAGNSFTFNSLISIGTWDPVANDFDLTTPFTRQGDSGSAIYNDAGEILGLYFLSSTDTTTNEKISYACHIEEVETSLGITVPGSRAGLSGAPGAPIAALDRDPSGDDIAFGDVTIARASVDQVAEALDQIVQETRAGRAWRGLFEAHQYEVLKQVNAKRGVTLAWQRGAGPAWLAALIRSAQRTDYKLPNEIDGVTPLCLARDMRRALHQAGGPELRADLDRYGDQLEHLIADTKSAPQGVRLLTEHAPKARELEASDG